MDVQDPLYDDELDCNPFFAALQGEFRRDFEEAVRVEGSLVCVPVSDVPNIDRGFIRGHLFRPSPYFKGYNYVQTLTEHFLAAGHNLDLQTNERVIEIADKHVVRISGFPENSRVKIFQEELGYNTKGKSYKIFLIERPLDSVKQKLREEHANERTEASSSCALDGTVPANVTECGKILQTFGDGKVLTSLEVKVLMFTQNYLLLPRYVDDAGRKLKAIVDTTLEDILRENCHLDAKATATVHAAIESYVLAAVHPKLFPTICQHLKAEDTKLSEKLLELRQLNVSASQLGADPLFACPLPATVVELATLDSLACPRRKMQCLKNVMDLIMAEIKQNLQESQGVLTPPGGMPFLTSDNLIPVLLTAVVCAQLQHLASNIYYAENFVWSGSSKDAHSYSLVTFKAAIEFLKMLDIGQLKPRSDTAKKELSLAELMKVTENLEGKTIRSEDDDGNTQWTPVDRQMERIARMIEASTRELTAVQHQGVMQSDTCIQKT